MPPDRAGGDDGSSLRSVGLKATPPRLKILQLLRQGPRRHWSADDLYRQLASAGEDVGLATVYRVLSQLEQASIVRRSSFDGGKAVFEVDDGPHHDHLVCVGCGLVDEFVDEGIEQRQRAVAAARGFELAEHRLAMYGLCSRCRG